jgi:phage baseplate assembly protein gpV
VSVPVTGTGTGTIDIMRRVARAELATRRGCRLAVVTATHPHEAEDDENNYEVDVRLKHEDLELHRVPVCTTIPGFVASPRVDDLVLLDFLDGDLAQPLVIACLYHAAEHPPIYADGELVIEHRAPDDTLNQLRFAADGSIQLQREVTKTDHSEATARILLDPDGTIRITVKDKITFTLAEDGITLESPNVPVSVECDGLTVKADLTVQGDLKVEGAGGSTTISGHEITGA